MKTKIANSTKGFTLAELMAVVVIIGILAALALGAYHKSVERARFSEAVANAHALAAAVDAYYYDHNFTAPGNNFLKDTAAVSLSRSSALTGNMLKTDSFVYSYDTSTKKITALRNDSSAGFALYVYPEIAGKNKQDECYFGKSDAKVFCESMGYTNCSENVCTKP